VVVAEPRDEELAQRWLAQGVPFTLRQLQLFVAVAETGSISGAGERLLVSPTAVAQALGQLEKALGETLFTRRRSKGVVLTPTGRHTLERARAVLASVEDFYQEATHPGGELGGTVAIGCVTSLGPTLLPALMWEYSERHPQVALSFREGDHAQLTRQLAEGEIDLLLCYDFALPEGTQRVRIGSRTPAVLLPANHWSMASGDEPLDLTAIAHEPYILLDTPLTRRHALSMLAEMGIEPRVRYRSANIETVRSFVGRGFGWTLLLQRPRTDQTYEGRRVVIRSLRQSIPPSSVVVAWPRDRQLSRAARALVDSATELARRGFEDD
jgi:DNA-binding transcriptional LysR family regulator